MTRVYFLEIIACTIVIILILFHSIAAAFWVRHLWCWMKRKQLQLIQLADSDQHSVVKSSVSYNLGTDITKTKFLIAISILEVVVLYYIISISLLFDSVKLEVEKSNLSYFSPNCFVDSHGATLYYYQWFNFLYALWVILFILYILLLAFLCRYLSQRILNLPHRRALKQYCIWFLIQTVLLLACSTIYTFIISYILAPALLFINWMLLVREGMQLFRVLKSQLLEIFLFEYKNEKYNHLVRAKKTFLIYIKFTIAVIFLMVTLFTVSEVSNLLRMIINDLCLIFIIYNANTFLLIESSATYNTLKSLHFSPIPYNYFITIIGIIMQLLLSIPYIYYTFLIILNIISKRFVKRQYRFNYENLQIPLIRKT